jgi:hypothetical protein
MQQVAVFRYSETTKMWAINNYVRGISSKTNRLLNSWKPCILDPKTKGRYDFRVTILNEDYRRKSLPDVEELIRRFDPIY